MMFRIWKQFQPAAAAADTPTQTISIIRLNKDESVAASAWKSSIRRFVSTEKAPTRAFSWLTGVDPMVSQREIGSATQLS